MNRNSVVPYRGSTSVELQEALGITQFPTASGWYQILGGLVIQGGLESFTIPEVRTINFLAPLDKQLLGVFISPVSASNGPHGHIVLSPGLTSFQINHHGPTADYYWWAVGA